MIDLQVKEDVDGATFDVNTLDLSIQLTKSHNTYCRRSKWMLFDIQNKFNLRLLFVSTHLKAVASGEFFSTVSTSL